MLTDILYKVKNNTGWSQSLNIPVVKNNVLFLAIGMLCFWLAAFALFFKPYPWLFNDITLSLLIACSFAAHLWFFNRFSMQTYIAEIENVLKNIVMIGFPALLTAIFLHLFPQQFWLKVLYLYLVLLYMLMALVMYRKLMFESKTLSLIRHWRFVLAVLFFACILHISIKINLAFQNIAAITLVFGWILSGFLALRIRWIALLNRIERKIVFAYLLLINLINPVIIYSFFNFQLDIFIHRPWYANVFGLLLCGIVVTYSVLSLLALLFTYPIASVLEDHKQELSSFEEINQVLLEDYISVEKIFHKLFNICLENTKSKTGWVLLKEDGHENIIHPYNISSNQIGQLNIKINFKEVIKQVPVKGYYYFPDLRKLKTLAGEDSSYCSMLILPAFSQGKLLAAICLLKPFTDGYDEYKIRLAKSYVDKTKMAVENTELVSKTIQAARYKEELEIANKVQKALVPEAFPISAYCEIAVFYESAKEVGGDFYDYNMVNEDQMAIIIGDVSGKGTSAAFHMAQMKGIFQALMQLCLSAQNFMIMANQAIANCLDKSKFITAIYILLDFNENKLIYSRAGHCPILYYSAKDKKVSYLHEGGLGLGIIRSNNFIQFVEEKQLNLTEGDVFVFYTDGLVEGRQKDSSELYGYERLEQCLNEQHHLKAEEIKNKICEDFKIFTNEDSYVDDTTLLVIKINELD